MWRDSIEQDVDDIIQDVTTNTCTRSPNEFEGKKVILYGAGIDGISVLHALGPHVQVVSFMDIRADEIGEIHGIPVKRPDQAVVADSEKETITVLVTVKPFKPRNEAIERTLRENGYSSIVRATDLFENYSFTAHDRDNLDSIRDSILACARAMQDKQSYEAYSGFIKSHASMRYDRFVSPSGHTKYFDTDFADQARFDRFIDCGAFNGDTLRDLKRTYGKVEKVALFESDEKTFQELLHSVREDRDSYANQLTIFPCGVWSHTVKLRAHNGMGLNSHIADSGSDTIQCVALDEVLSGFEPTCLKLDVEGAEYEALLGARKTISRFRPNMILSLYHKLRDMWELPALVSGWDLGYTFNVRVYGQGGNATMLYAFAE